MLFLNNGELCLSYDLTLKSLQILPLEFSGNDDDINKFIMASKKLEKTPISLLHGIIKYEGGKIEILIKNNLNQEYRLPQNYQMFRFLKI